MNNTTIIAITTLIIGAVGGYFIAEDNNRYRQNDNTPSGMHRMSDGSLMSNDSRNQPGMMMDHGMMMVTSEKEFILGMIPHHQEAVDTAKEVLARGGTTLEIRTLAENIITAQEKEIADMKAWYLAWYDTEYRATGKYQPMMRDLSSLSGAELDRTFLEDMVMHHTGAIMMANSVERYTEHQEMKDLTKAIITTQSAEIELMKRLRAGL